MKSPQPRKLKPVFSNPVSKEWKTKPKPRKKTNYLSTTMSQTWKVASKYEETKEEEIDERSQS